ncbi:Lrp/AsnC family transcriptional regulator [Aquisediminimonas profunda]|uniref:Lrp/AsnC family transcriptional regulator n=1 Tax=Aquisediminimonas profunda TaxID=1550733 RepID=UPI001FE3B304|nr:Lrp/AsnC family transcriptional regulator [Aquisediminimonas profunda]
MLDEFDRKILQVLQRDSSRTTSDVAEHVGLSQAPCWRRIQRLKNEGIIRAQVSLVDRKLVGLNAQVFAQVKLTAHGRTHLSDFAEAIRGFAEVLECYVMMGSTDFMLRIVTKDIEAYERFFFDTLSKVPGVQEITSMVALSEIKSTTELPLAN